MPIIECKKLTKRYGHNLVLRDLDLRLEGPQVVGLLGPNGCGKTTLLHLLTGLQRQYRGEISINGRSPASVETLREVSMLPDSNYLLDYDRVNDALRMQHRAFGEAFDVDWARALLERFQVPLHESMRNLSKGMQEKLQITLCLARRTSIYLLDEPLGAVDPMARDEVFSALFEEHRQDSLFLISTHLVSELENYLDTAVFLGDGRVVLQGSCDELRDQYQRNLRTLFAEVYRR